MLRCFTNCNNGRHVLDTVVDTTRNNNRPNNQGRNNGRQNFQPVDIGQRRIHPDHIRAAGGHIGAGGAPIQGEQHIYDEPLEVGHEGGAAADIGGGVPAQNQAAPLAQEAIEVAPGDAPDVAPEQDQEFDELFDKLVAFQKRDITQDQQRRLIDAILGRNPDDDVSQLSSIAEEPLNWEEVFGHDDPEYAGLAANNELNRQPSYNSTHFGSNHDHSEHTEPTNDDTDHDTFA